MKIYPYEIEVSRRDKDFNYLREYFRKVYPHILVPSISESKHQKKYEESYARKRSNVLTRFINKVLQIPELKASEVLLEFLKSKSPKNVSKTLKAGMSKQKPLDDASQFMTISGEHPISIDPALLQFSDKFPMYVNSYEVLSKQFYTLSKQLSSQYGEIASTQQKLAQCSKHLSTMYKLCHSDNISEMYKDIEKMMKRWARGSKEINGIVSKNFVNFYKYFALEKQPLVELNELKTSFTTQFKKLDSVLSKQKEKLFKSGSTTKWELTAEDLKNEEELKTNKEKAFAAMLPRDTIKWNYLNNNFMMINTQGYNEARRANQYDYQLTQELYKEICDKMKLIVKDELKIWDILEKKSADYEIIYPEKT